MVNIRKAAMIGCGFVGSSSAFALMQSGIFSEMVMIDVNREKAEGEAMDIAHGLPFARPIRLYAGTYDDIVDAAIIIITAGANQKPDETRLLSWSHGTGCRGHTVPPVRPCHKAKAKPLSARHPQGWS